MDAIIASSLATMRPVSGDRSKKNTLVFDEVALYLEETDSGSSSDDSSAVSMVRPPRKQRMNVEITDLKGRRVLLERQVAALQRAVLEPLEKELTELIDGESLKKIASTEEQELEIVLQASLSMVGTEEVCEFLQSEGQDIAAIIPLRKSASSALVDPGLRFQLEGELSAMHKSLEKKEGRSFSYAYHLERFRQIFILTMKQYDGKLVDLDYQRKIAEENVRVAGHDAETNRMIVANCSERVLRAESAAKQLDTLMEYHRLESAKQIESLKKERNIIKNTLDSELRESEAENDELEFKIKKLEGCKKEAKSAKKLNTVLNEKLSTKTKEGLTLFGENLKLREECMLHRNELKALKGEFESHSNELDTALQVNEDLRRENTLLLSRANPETSPEWIARTEHLEAQVQEAFALAEIQYNEIDDLKLAVGHWKQEAATLSGQVNCDNDGMFSMLADRDMTLRELIKLASMQEQELRVAHGDKESLTLEVIPLQSGMESESEIMVVANKSFQVQIKKDSSRVELQSSRVLNSNQEVLLHVDEESNAKHAIESETIKNAKTAGDVRHKLQELLTLQENQAELFSQLEKRNEVLAAKYAEVSAKLEAHKEESARLTYQLKAQILEATTLATVREAELLERQDEDDLLESQLDSLKLEMEAERSAAAQAAMELIQELETHTKDNLSLKKEVSKLKFDLESEQEEKACLSKQSQATDCELTTLRQEREKLEEDIADLKLQKFEVEKTFNDKIDVDTVDLEVVLVEQPDALERNAETIEETKVEIQKLKSGLESAMEENMLLGEQSKAAKIKLDAMRQEHCVVREEVETLKTEKSVAEKHLEAYLENAMLDSSLVKFDLFQVKSDLEAEREQNSKLSQESSAVAEKMDALQKENALLKKENDRLSTENPGVENSLRGELDQATMRYSSLNFEVLQMRAAMESEREETERLREHSDATIIKLELLRQQHANGGEELEQLKSSNTESRREVEESREKVTKLDEQLGSLNAEVEAERKEAAEVTNSLRDELNSVLLENDMLQFEISQLRSHLESELEQNMTLSEQSQDTVDQLQTLRSEQAILQKEIEIFRSKTSEFVTYDDEVILRLHSTEETHEALEVTLSATLESSSLSQLIANESLINDSFNNIISAYDDEDLDAALRDNEALLREVSEKGISTLDRQALLDDSNDTPPLTVVLSRPMSPGDTSPHSEREPSSCQSQERTCTAIAQNRFNSSAGTASESPHGAGASTPMELVCQPKDSGESTTNSRKECSGGGVPASSASVSLTSSNDSDSASNSCCYKCPSKHYQESLQGSEGRSAVSEITFLESEEAALVSEATETSEEPTQTGTQNQPALLLSPVSSILLAKTEEPDFEEERSLGLNNIRPAYNTVRDSDALSDKSQSLTAAKPASIGGPLAESLNTDHQKKDVLEPTVQPSDAKYDAVWDGSAVGVLKEREGKDECHLRQLHNFREFFLSCEIALEETGVEVMAYDQDIFYDCVDEVHSGNVQVGASVNKENVKEVQAADSALSPNCHRLSVVNVDQRDANASEVLEGRELLPNLSPTQGCGPLRVPGLVESSFGEDIIEKVGISGGDEEEIRTESNPAKSQQHTLPTKGIRDAAASSVPDVTGQKLCSLSQEDDLLNKLVFSVSGEGINYRVTELYEELIHTATDEWENHHGADPAPVFDLYDESIEVTRIFFDELLKEESVVQHAQEALDEIKAESLMVMHLKSGLSGDETGGEATTEQEAETETTQATQRIALRHILNTQEEAERNEAFQQWKISRMRANLSTPSAE